jgi:polyvinyl alcohol dehydrogenase (cytochrome)
VRHRRERRSLPRRPRAPLVGALAVAATLLGVSAATAAPAPVAATGDWPQLAHDNRSTFQNVDAGITLSSARRLRVMWRWSAPGSVNGTPAVVGGHVYVVSLQGTASLDPRGGQVQWLNRAATGTASPTVRDHRVYVFDGGTTLHCLDASTGGEIWKTKVDDQQYASGFSSPVVSGRLVIVGVASVAEVAAQGPVTFRGSVVALDRTSGVVVWRHATADPPADGVGVWSSVSVDEATNTVFASTGNNYTNPGPTSDAIIAMDLSTGATRWVRQVDTGDVFTFPHPESADTDFGTNPVLFDATVGGQVRHLLAAGQKSGRFWVLDRTTGAVVWNRTVSTGSALIGGVFNNGASDGHRLILAGNDGGPGAARVGQPNAAHRSDLVALNPATGRVLWQRHLDGWVWAPITLSQGVGFVAVDTEMQAFDVTTGRLLARVPTEGTIASGPALSGGRAFFGSGLSYFGTKPGHTLYALG